MFDLAVSMGKSKDPVVISMSKKMDHVSGGGLGLALTAKIESLRYTTDPMGLGDLEDALLMGGMRLKNGGTIDADLQQGYAYLSELILDVGVGEMSRACAVQALAMGGSWQAQLESGAKTLSSDPPDVVYGVTLMGLVNGASGNKQRSQEVVELLGEVLAHVHKASRKAELTKFIHELEG